MKCKEYLAGYTVFVGGILTFVFGSLLVESQRYSELGVEGAILISILGSIILYSIGIISLFLMNLIGRRVIFIEPRRYFFTWAFLTGFLCGIFAFEVFRVAPFDQYPFTSIILLIVAMSMIYIFSKKFMRQGN